MIIRLGINLLWKITIYPRWRDELAENPEIAFSGNGNKYKDKARIAELERLLGQARAENALEKALKNRWTESLQGLIYRSDQGVQYASKDYIGCLKLHSALGHKSPDQFEMEVALNTVAYLPVYYHGCTPLGNCRISAYTRKCLLSQTLYNYLCL